MSERVFRWLFIRLRPAEGWLIFILFVIAWIMFIRAILEVGWVRDDQIVVWTGAVGMIISFLLAKRGRSPVWDWIIITAYTILTTILFLSKYSFRPLFDGGRIGQLYLQRDALVATARFLNWLAAVMAGRSTRETIGFALLLGLGAGLLTAIFTWRTFRSRRPLPAIIMILLLLGLNLHYGGESSLPFFLFALFAVVLVGVVYSHEIEQSWIERGIDYTEQIRIDILLAAGVIGITLVGFSWLFVDLNTRLTRAARAFQESEAVLALDRTLEQAFGGVKPSQAPGLTAGVAGEGGFITRGAAVGTFPRSFLLGDPPELSEAEVFAARVTGRTGPGAIHWRTTSYGVYTGLGWLLGDETESMLRAGQPLPVDPQPRGGVITQTVTWLGGGPISGIFTLGQPRSIDQNVIAFKRFDGDITRLMPPPGSALMIGALQTYTAVSTRERIEPDALRQALLEDLPADLLAYYTALPDSISDRVRSLAEEVAGGEPTPYDQARALEAFLRQYPYTLEVEPPPEAVEPVDYFLFDLQTGYCDYFATSMVVMARSLGLPARLGVGYLAQPAEADGLQHIRRADGHSWAEIYFTGVGWVEFEPTASFPTALAESEQGAAAAGGVDMPIEPSVPIPREVENRVWVWLVPLFLLGLAVAYGYYQEWSAARARRDDVVWSYGRLLRSAGKLQVDVDPSATPREFGRYFNRALETDVAGSNLEADLDPVQADVTELVASFERRQYGRRASEGQRQAENIQAINRWEGVKRLVRRLRMRRFWVRRGRERTGLD